MTDTTKKKQGTSTTQHVKHTGPYHGITDLSKYSSMDQWEFIKSLKRVFNESNPPAMISHLYPDSHHLFDKVHKDIITIYGKDWTFHNNTPSLRQVIIGRNCDNVLPETIESHQSSLREGKLPIDIDLGPNKVVSRKHILIHKVPNNDKDWFITILGRNSCKINGRRISNKKLKISIGPLKSGTILDIGDTQMMICFGNNSFPFLTLPYYSYLIPKLMTMYGLNGNNNPLLRDIINTSTYAKKQKLALEREGDDIIHDDVTEEENILENTVMEDNIIVLSPNKHSLENSSPEVNNNKKSDLVKNEDLKSNENEPNPDIQITKKPKLDPKIKATSFYSNTDTSESPVMTPTTTTKTNNITKTDEKTPAPPDNLLKNPSKTSNNEEESLVKKLVKKHHDNNDQQSVSTTKRPSWQYTTLITRAILSRPEACMPLNSIYEYISTLHPYYDMSVKKWQNSVRHNLSVHDTFVKIRYGGGGSVWKLNDDVVQEFLENWYQGNLIKLKKTSGGVTKELCLFMSKETNKFPGQKDPQFYKDAYRKRMESEKKEN